MFHGKIYVIRVIIRSSNCATLWYMRIKDWCFTIFTSVSTPLSWDTNSPMTMDGTSTLIGSVNVTLSIEGNFINNIKKFISNTWFSISNCICESSLFYHLYLESWLLQVLFIQPHQFTFLYRTLKYDVFSLQFFNFIKQNLIMTF